MSAASTDAAQISAQTPQTPAATAPNAAAPAKPAAKPEPKKPAEGEITAKEREAYERIKGGTKVPAPGATTQPSPDGAKTGAKPSEAAADKGKPEPKGAAGTAATKLSPEDRDAADRTLLAHKEGAEIKVTPQLLERAKDWLARFKVKPETFAKMSPQEAIELAAHHAQMQSGLDRMLRPGKTSASTPKGAAGKADPEEGDEGEPGTGHAADASDTDDVDPDSIQVTEADLSAEDREAIEAVLDPDKADKLKARLLKAAKAEKLASAREAQAKTAREHNTEARKQVIWDRVQQARREVAARVPQLSEQKVFDAVLREIDARHPNLLQQMPTADDLVKFMRSAAGAVLADELIDAVHTRPAKEAAKDLDGQMLASTVQSGATPSAGMDAETAAYHARKQAGNDQKEFRRLLNAFRKPAASGT